MLKAFQYRYKIKLGTFLLQIGCQKIEKSTLLSTDLSQSCDLRHDIKYINKKVENQRIYFEISYLKMQN